MMMITSSIRVGGYKNKKKYETNSIRGWKGKRRKWANPFASLKCFRPAAGYKIISRQIVGLLVRISMVNADRQQSWRRRRVLRFAN